MCRNEIFKELRMSYLDLVEYLIEKYGEATGDYFCTADCRSKNKKISRTGEGLYCHHIDEDKGGNLSDSFSAKTQPYEWQKKERLVYCNILEHLILHIKIAVLRQKKRLYQPIEVGAFFSTGGIYMVCSELNDMFSQNGTTTPWKQRCYEEVKENYNDYITLLKILLAYIHEQYVAEKSKNIFLKVGTKFTFAGKNAEIIEIGDSYSRIRIRMEDGRDKIYKRDLLWENLTFSDQMDLVTRRLATSYETFVQDIYDDIMKVKETQEIIDLSHALLIDFHGYGFPQLTDFLIDKSQYGAINADEYIAKAYPATMEPLYPIIHTNPVFWTGEIPKDVMKSKMMNYLVRIDVAFDIKFGKQPFVRYKERDLLRVGMDMEITNENNLLYRQGIVLDTSNIYDSKTGRYYSKIKEKNGEIVDASVKLTLTKEDFSLFKEVYRIRSIRILDGCYFPLQ